jgi:hypothetical protein
MVVLLTGLLVFWLQDLNKRRWQPLLIGGVIGLLLLLRPQIVVLVPAILLFVVLLFSRRPTLALINIGLIVFGLGLTLMPWLFRSYQLTGSFMLNEPGQTAFLTEQYRLEPGTAYLERLPGEKDKAYSQRVKAYISQFVRQHPGFVAGFVSSHFIHNQVEMIVTLPMSPWFVQNPNSDYYPYWAQKGARLWEECCSPKAYVGAMPFWDQWAGDLSAEMLVSLAFSLALVALGLAVAWARHDIAGLIPLGIGLIYSLSTAVGRYSGWRLILPADWVLFLYYATGSGQIAVWVYAYITGKASLYPAVGRRKHVWGRATSAPERISRNLPKGICYGLILLAIGLSPLIVEGWPQARFQPITPNSIVSELDNAQITAEGQQKIEHFIRGEEALILNGRALYPRYYRTNEGEPGNGWPAFAPRPYSRLGFYLVGPVDAQVVLAQENLVSFFPDGADVITVGCQRDGFVDALAVILIGETNQVIMRSPLSTFSCPSPSP